MEGSLLRDGFRERSRCLFDRPIAMLILRFVVVQSSSVEGVLASLYTQHEHANFLHDPSPARSAA